MSARTDEARVSLPIRVIPRARSDAVVGAREGRLVVRVSAPPVQGAANRAAIALVAGALGLRERDVRLERGAGSRDKVLSVPASARGLLERAMK